MEPLMKNVLEAAGVDLSASFTIPTSWNEWLDIDSPTSLESLAPYSPALYEAFSKLLEYAWRNVMFLRSGGTTTSSTTAAKAAVDDASSLAAQVEAVQATVWLRHVMDLSVADENGASFSSLLLLSTPNSNTTLVQALYHHVASLPLLQQQIHCRAQEMRQQATKHFKNNNTTTTVQSRLKHYQATQAYSDSLLQQLEEHVLRLEYILGEWYSVASVEMRRTSRQLLGTLWHDFLKTSLRPSSTRLENTSATGIDMTLRVLLRILQGTTTTTQSQLLLPSYKHLLFHQLLPLHAPNAMVLWRDQTSLLNLYHEPLVQCMSVLLQHDPSLLPTTVQALLQSNIWPTGGNTPKVILLLHEVDTLIGMSTSMENWNDCGAIVDSLVWRVATCASSDNSRMAERALQFFRNDVFCELVMYQHYESSVGVFLKALVKVEVPWNPTVRKMTLFVLQTLQEHDADKFAQVAERTFGGDGVVSSTMPTRDDTATGTTKTDTSMNIDETPITSSKQSSSTNPHPSSSSSRFSLKAGMGNWRPPRTSAPAHAKYAMGPPKSRPSSKKAAPPLTITGVAPWAGESKLSFGHKRNAGEASLPEKTKPHPPQPAILKDEQESPGLQRVLDYMNQLKPPNSESNDDSDGTSPWAKAQMAETPTLLTSLKFHNLVFGHDLGKGAFGTVRYARQISKSTTRSQWPEYAVKIISTAKIQEMGYEASVQREIATLRVQSHPCIARLVSSFRFGDGAYLVLEYASGGDLFALLSKKGSLDQESTKFVIGEVASALASIHDNGFVYADLKPENVLITETGHVKLTDFGGCRPLTDAARELIRPSGKHLLKELRNGDWKERPKENDDENEDMEDVSESQEGEEDMRIEGTTAYLPPEVVMGQVPTAAADSWALGCVMYQCLSGRPPLLDNDEHATKQKIVTFHMDEGHGQTEDDEPLFRDAHGSDISTEARQLIRRLLSPLDQRPSISQVAQDPFFAGTDIFTLHRQPAVALDVGTVAPVEDATWSRRQYSSIWAPQPKAYDISIPSDKQIAVNPILASKAPIPEGEEATAFFSWKSSRE